ncbi:hypothetical protein [Acidiferrobacter thiooxydans]|uniref:Uncharacterized protein n=1 Tax=Acidiferrobacter thiooxydans TaxID=163359 RepID=A0A368HMC1_9GAMM|nr:hypothetical protein [Acidiferrobacter thiooxydans]RCN59450.1 hypothetical protein C4900_07110 [Acidiferrobacter thiooxydans]
MSTVANVDALVIRNMSTIEQSIEHLINVIEPRVFGAINEEITDWIEKKRWVGEATYNDQHLDIWLRPVTWRTSPGEPAEHGPAYFYIMGLSEEEDWSWVTILCGANKDEIGFVTEFDWRGAGLAKKDWKALAQEHQAKTPSCIKRVSGLTIRRVCGPSLFVWMPRSLHRLSRKMTLRPLLNRCEWR